MHYTSRGDGDGGDDAGGAAPRDDIEDVGLHDGAEQMRGAVRQEWALVGGSPRHVSEFAGLSPKDRPAGTCLECKQPVIFKCGEVRSHHVAHRAAADECEAASGEGAEHYNAKLYLASMLRHAGGFEALLRCARCGAWSGSECLEYRYDRVELEYSHPNRLRADIALFLGGELSCAIEIYVSHRCDHEKIAYHREAKIPCLELSAQYAQGWHPSQPLSPTAIHGGDNWICAECQELSARALNESPAGHQHYAPPVELRAPPVVQREDLSKVKRKTIALQKIFFTDPPRDLPFEQTFVTVEYTEDELDGEIYLKRLFVWDSGKIIRVLREAHPPYDERKDEGFRKAYQGYVEELEASYGPVRKGHWMTFPKGSKSSLGGGALSPDA